MKLKQEIVHRITDNLGLRRELISVLDITRQTLATALKTNEPNGQLTKAAALKVIADHYNITMEEILADEENKAA